MSICIKTDTYLEWQGLIKVLFENVSNIYDIDDIQLVAKWIRQTSNISRTLEGNELADHSNVDGALPVGAALIASLF